VGQVGGVPCEVFLNGTSVGNVAATDLVNNTGGTIFIGSTAPNVLDTSCSACLDPASLSLFTPNIVAFSDSLIINGTNTITLVYSDPFPVDPNTGNDGTRVAVLYPRTCRNISGLLTDTAITTPLIFAFTPAALSFSGVDERSVTHTFEYTCIVPIVPMYGLTASEDTIEEGDSVTFTLATTDIADGTVIQYNITGIDQSDLSFGSLAGSFIVNNNTATALFTTSKDTLTDGEDIMTMTLQSPAAAAGISVSVTILDTSTFPPSYNLYSSTDVTP